MRNKSNETRQKRASRDRASGETPGVLPGKLHLLLSILKLDIKHLGEVLTQAVGGSSLNTAAGGRNEGLHSGGVITPSELLIFGFLSFACNHN